MIAKCNLAYKTCYISCWCLHFDVLCKSSLIYIAPYLNNNILWCRTIHEINVIYTSVHKIKTVYTKQKEESHNYLCNPKPIPWHTSAQALSTDNFSMVEALSLYSGVVSRPSFNFAKDDTSSWWTRRRSLRSRATPLPIQQLHTCVGGKTHVYIDCQSSNYIPVWW